MARRTNHLPEELYAYLLQVSVREPPIMTRLRDETASLEKARMQIGPDQGQFMALLVELMGAVVISMIIILLLYKVFDKVQ